MKTEIETIKVNGVDYVRADSVPQAAPNGRRAVIVIDRGWIAAGDVEQPGNGYIYLSRAVWVFRWESIGFDGMIANPKKAEIKPFPNGFTIPEGAEIFRVPVADDWGL